MSIKWKWLLATFFAQFLVGSLFSAVQFQQLGHQAEQRLGETFDFIAQELSHRLPNAQEAKPDQLLKVARDLSTQHNLGFVQVRRGSQLLLRMGSDLQLESDQLQVDAQVHQAQGAYFKTLAMDARGTTLTLGFWEAEVLRERNGSVAFVAQVLFFSSVASCLMLWGLSQTLTARLSQLRDRAQALQAGQTGVRMEVTGNDEITILSRAFNGMVNAIDRHIDSLKASNVQLESERNRMNSLLSSINTGIAYLDQEFQVLYANKSFAKHLNLPWPMPNQASLMSMLLSAKLLPEQHVILPDLLREHFHRRQLPLELDLQSGKTLQLKYQVQNDDQLGVYGIVMVEDVSLHKNVQDLRQEVERDPLTQTMNRRGFDFTLDNRLSRLIPGETLGLLFLDLDGFKMVNDTLGHKAGDQVLRSAADVLNNACRTVDVVARLGGDEFAIIVAKASRSLLENMAERIIKAFEREPLFKRILQNHELRVSCSIGCAMYPEHGDTAHLLLEQGDQQMYQAKRAGKNCYRIAGAAHSEHSGVRQLSGAYSAHTQESPSSPEMRAGLS